MTATWEGLCGFPLAMLSLSNQIGHASDASKLPVQSALEYSCALAAAKQRGEGRQMGAGARMLLCTSISAVAVHMAGLPCRACPACLSQCKTGAGCHWPRPDFLQREDVLRLHNLGTAWPAGQHRLEQKKHMGSVKLGVVCRAVSCSLEVVCQQCCTGSECSGRQADLLSP